ncbi:MAG TPA: hypothetical protein DDW50_06290 [Firmicutes bacterium]|nr:hypothetical protein [Bacillota bacterium]
MEENLRGEGGARGDQKMKEDRKDHRLYMRLANPIYFSKGGSFFLLIGIAFLLLCSGPTIL